WAAGSRSRATVSASTAPGRSTGEQALEGSSEMTVQSTTATTVESTTATETAAAAGTVSSGKVPIGLATQAGYGVAIAGLVGAVVAYATGDHSQAQLGSIVSGSIAVISLVVTQIGRYVQANTQIKANRELVDAYSQVTGAVQVIERAD